MESYFFGHFHFLKVYAKTELLESLRICHVHGSKITYLPINLCLVRTRRFNISQFVIWSGVYKLYLLQENLDKFSDKSIKIWVPYNKSCLYINAWGDKSYSLIQLRTQEIKYIWVMQGESIYGCLLLLSSIFFAISGSLFVHYS